VEWDEEDEEHPLRMLRACAYPKQELDVEPLLITVLAFEAKGKSHYVGVTSLNRLLNADKTGKQSRRGCKHCERYFQPFATSILLDKHRAYCYTGQPETLVPAADEAYHIFKRWQAIQQLPYVVYADIECFLVPKANGKRERERESKLII